MIRESIATLAEGRPISGEQAYETMREIMSGEATDAQVAAYITALRLVGEGADVIAGSGRAMREKATPVASPDEMAIDIVGTGGDGAHTFNISTAAALVAAGAGATVAKHGNRSVSSRCGAADVLEALEVNIGISPERMEDCLREIGVAFLFAPSLHPAMKYAGGPRREIGIRTVFNILGPLTNPAGALRGVLGVYAMEMVELIAEAAAKLGTPHLFVVHGSDGLDEFTVTGPTEVAEVTAKEVKRYRLDPGELGLASGRPEDLRGGDPAENAEIIRSILAGAPGPRRDVVRLTAGAGLVAAGKAGSLQEGLDAAAQAIDSGAARAKLDALVAKTNA